MLFFNKLNLRLFGGEGAGAGSGAGDGAAAGGEASGAEAVDPGRQRLLELGVPESKLRKNRSYTLPQQAPKQVPQAEAGSQVDAAAKESPEEGKPAAGRMSWDEIMADPEYNKQMQATVQARLRSAKGAEEHLQALTPALELLARQHGIDYSKGIDYAALAKAVSDDDQFYEDKALEMGVDIATARKLDQDERNTARAQRQAADQLEQQRMDAHFASLEAQSNALKAKFPNFDLRAELKNPQFARMVGPQMNMPVEAAYNAIHYKEIQAASMQVAAQRTAQQMSAAIASGSRRPAENGTSRQTPSSVSMDYRNATPEQRAAFKARLRREGTIPMGSKF